MGYSSGDVLAPTRNVLLVMNSSWIVFGIRTRVLAFYRIGKNFAFCVDVAGLYVLSNLRQQDAQIIQSKETLVKGSASAGKVLPKTGLSLKPSTGAAEQKVWRKEPAG
jgi:hypothetical protein